MTLVKVENGFSLRKSKLLEDFPVQSTAAILIDVRRFLLLKFNSE